MLSYCSLEYGLVSIICYFFDDRGLFYILCIVFCLVILMFYVDKVEVDSVYYLVVSSFEDWDDFLGSNR